MQWVHFRASESTPAEKEDNPRKYIDITRAKELEHLLVIQDKMASLGRVAAGIAHEIRNPLSGINIYLNTLKKLDKKDETRKGQGRYLPKSSLLPEKLN